MNSRNLALVLATFGAAACGDLGTGSTPFLSRLILSGRVTLGGQALDSVERALDLLGIVAPDRM